MNIAWQDFLWLLLPLAVASGWFAARVDRRKSAHHQAHPVSPDYFRGINYLLDEQHDRAIELFIQMVEVDESTIETHLALGSLFRRRGEAERAIRVHQSLVSRPSLNPDQRAVALCELALDYQKAGLLDRAEGLFLELTEVTDHAEKALRALMHIYEQEKDWEKAIVAGQRLIDRFGKPLGAVLAQYCCELAERALQESRNSIAEKYLADATRHDRRCARVNMIRGRQAFSAGNYKEAITQWHKIRDQDRYLLDEIIDDMVTAYRELGDEQGLRRFLDLVTAEHASTKLLRVLIEIVEHEQGSRAAWECAIDRIRKYPSLQGVRELMDLVSRHRSVPDEFNVEAAREIVVRLADAEGKYGCRHCGFQGQTHHWQCPACLEWLGIRPKMGEPELGLPATGSLRRIRSSNKRPRIIRA